MPEIQLARYRLYRPATDSESRTEDVINTFYKTGYRIAFIVPTIWNRLRPLYILELMDKKK